MTSSSLQLLAALLHHTGLVGLERGVQGLIAFIRALLNGAVKLALLVADRAKTQLVALQELAADRATRSGAPADCGAQQREREQSAYHTGWQYPP